MPISNPCRWYVDSGVWDDTRCFNYPEGSTKLWHFSPNTNKMSTTMEMNIVWFADDKKQALERLRAMCVFRLECAREYEKNYGRPPYDGAALKHAETIINAIDEGTLKISPAPMDQFYKVGWALNDTL